MCHKVKELMGECESYMGRNEKGNKKRKRPGRVMADEYSANIVAVVIFITTYGLIMICSASYTNGLSYFKRQIFFVVLGIMFIIFLCRSISREMIKLFTPMVYYSALATIFLLLTPLAVEVNGATRWLNLGFTRFQVAEVVKLAVVLRLAYMISNHPELRKDRNFLIKLWVTGGFPAGLLFIISNDLSSAAVILLFTFVVTFVFTRQDKLHIYFMIAAIALIALVLFYVKTHMPDANDENVNFRILRLAAWLEPERYSSSVGFQTAQSLYAIGSGGLFGKGLGNSAQKLGILPEAHTDFIFSIVCEELGIFGAVLLIALYIYLFYLIFQVIRRSKDPFDMILVVGILAHIMIQTGFNIGVVTGVLPNTGLPLMLMSYGGTSIFEALIEIGLVLKVESNNHQRIKRQKAEMNRQ